MSIETFTQVHVAISLIGILTGLVVLFFGLLGSNRLEGWTAVFLATTVLTSVTGFMFPIGGFTPALAVGTLSMAILAVALLALYVFRLSGFWRWVYVATAVAALYLNVFVAVVQAFQKIDVLNALAPNQSEPPFVIAHTLVLAIFVVLGILAVIRFRPAPSMA
jgi:hypothetical protein